MTRPDRRPLPEGIDALRDAVAAFAYVRESFLQQFSVEELLSIRQLWLQSEWDIYPDDWTRRQLHEALAYSATPRWDDEEKPVYSRPVDGSDLYFLLREAKED